ncbi:MAG: hypothetical protein U1F65_08100 [Verrucomicrobiota bacterium]
MRTFRVIALLLLFTARLPAATWSESFATSPFAGGWTAYGSTNLFQWAATNANLAVTWDSSQTNSFLFHPLGTILTKSDDFGFAFELTLADIAIGVNSNKPYTFELAAGFVNQAVATNANYRRGVVAAGTGARNLCEFDYFPDSGYGATISPTMISTNSTFSQFISGFSFPLELDTGAVFTVSMNYTAADKTLRTIVTRNGEPFGPVDDVILPSGFKDFRLDQFAIASYSDLGADGSLLAHGTVDNVVVTVPPPPVKNLSGLFTNQVWRAGFVSRSNWVYTLERSADFRTWTNACLPTAGNATNLFLEDLQPPAGGAFYRVKGERP